MYTNPMPTSGVVPVPEFGLTDTKVEFTGELLIAKNGIISGDITDIHGPAVISGQIDKNTANFQKRYTSGDLISQPPVHYELASKNSTVEKVICLEGKYCFTDDQTKQDGTVTMTLVHTS